MHEQVVVRVVPRAPRRTPAGPLHLPRLRDPLAVHRRGVGLRDVVVVASIRRPIGVHPGVEGPEGHVDPHRLEPLLLLQRVGAKPQPLDPAPEVRLHVLATDVERHQRLGADGIAVRLLGQDVRRAAIDTDVRSLGPFEGHPGATAPAARDPQIDTQPPFRLRSVVEGPLDDGALGAGHLGPVPAILAGEGVLVGTPAHVRPAGIAGELDLAAVLRLLDPFDGLLVHGASSQM